MNFQTMNKQRKFVLIAAAVGVISMFLPWVSVSVSRIYQVSKWNAWQRNICVFMFCCEWSNCHIWVIKQKILIRQCGQSP